LNTSINKLRQALNDDADSPPLRGYGRQSWIKFIATVEEKPFRPEQTDSPVNVSASDGPPSPTAAKSRVRLKDWGLRALELALAMASHLGLGCRQIAGESAQKSERSRWRRLV